MAWTHETAKLRIAELQAENERLREAAGRRKNLLEQTEDRFSQVMMENDCLDALIADQIAWLESEAMGMALGDQPQIHQKHFERQTKQQIAKLKKGVGKR